MWEPLES